MLRKSLCLLFFLALTLFTHSSRAQTQSYTESVFYNFCSQANCADGSSPFYDNLIQGSDGNYYGTTQSGGNSSDPTCGSGCGVIYRVTPTGTLTTLYAFCSQPSCPDGSAVSALIQGSDGNFYGTAIQGGAHSVISGLTAGTIFKITPTGTFTKIYDFCSQTNCTDGGGPTSALVQGTDGNFYGTTVVGGLISDCGGVGCGTAFKITPTGTLTTLHQFCSSKNCADGAQPRGALNEGADGNFYGYTDGFTQGDVTEPSTIFKITPAGAVTTLYDFCTASSCPNGTNPTGALLLSSDGNFYGVTNGGGVYSTACSQVGCGTTFKITPTGTFTHLYSFCSLQDCIDGYQPLAGLLQASDGNFYGTANGPAGSSGAPGVVFAMTPSGTMTTVYTFCDELSCGDGILPVSSLTQPANGDLYGVTVSGGSTPNCASNQCGTIFKISPAPALTPKSGAPVQLSLSKSQITLGESVTLDWKVLNGTSLTMRQCNAFVQYIATGAGTWTGPQAGSISNNVYQGSRTITPTANGVYTYALTCGGIESGFATLNVGDSKANSAISLTANNYIYIGNTDALLLATVSGQQTFPAPTGNVNFTVNGTSVGSPEIGNGAATLEIETGGMAFGTYTVKATYAGDTNYIGSSASIVINIEGYPTQTTLAVSPSTVVQGQNVTLSTSVTRTNSNVTPYGTVTFYTGSRVLGSAPLSSGNASLTFTTNNSIPPGTYPVVAKFSGDSADAASISPVVQVTVQSSESGTTTALTVTPTTLTQGQSATLSALVTNTTSPYPTGKVSFYANSVLLGIATLSSGVANLTGAASPSIVPGTYSVIAKYSGDANNQPSTSASVDVTVIAATTTTLTVTPNPVPANQSVTLSTTVKEKYQSAVPTGQVTFTVGSYTAGSVNLNAGAGSVNLSDFGIAAGTYPLTATYSGDNNNGPSSTTVSVTIK